MEQIEPHKEEIKEGIEKESLGVRTRNPYEAVAQG